MVRKKSIDFQRDFSRILFWFTPRHLLGQPQVSSTNFFAKKENQREKMNWWFMSRCSIKRTLVQEKYSSNRTFYSTAYFPLDTKLTQPLLQRPGPHLWERARNTEFPVEMIHKKSVKNGSPKLVRKYCPYWRSYINNAKNNLFSKNATMLSFECHLENFESCEQYFRLYCHHKQ